MIVMPMDPKSGDQVPGCQTEILECIKEMARGGRLNKFRTDK